MALSIHDAAWNGDLEGMMRLIEEDPEIVDDVNEYEYTALLLASLNGHLEVISYLLDQGPNIDRKGTNGRTALLHACGRGHLEVVELLLSRGADPTICDSEGGTPLMYASNQGHVDVVRCLVRNKAVRATIDTKGQYGRTALWYASFTNRTEVVKVLVEVGANPMVADRNGDTPLDMARDYGHDDCITILEVSPRQ